MDHYHLDSQEEIEFLSPPGSPFPVSQKVETLIIFSNFQSLAFLLVDKLDDI